MSFRETTHLMEQILPAKNKTTCKKSRNFRECIPKVGKNNTRNQSLGVMVMSENQASRQDIRPLRIALLNLMPRKIQTEIQFSRLIGATPLQIELTLIRMSDHQSKTTAAEHMTSFYRPFNEVAESGEKFDGLIITGAPIEHLPFEEVTYWDELRQIMDWTQTHVHSTFGVCWGGMAMIYHLHGINKRMLDAKAFGCFRHDNLVPASPRQGCK